jgi:hypothetical protein
MSLGVLVAMKKKQGCTEIRLIHGGRQGLGTETWGKNRIGKDPAPTEWALRTLLEEVLQSSPPMEPGRADLIYRRVVEKHSRQAERERRWIRRMGRTALNLMAAVAGSRAFRILTQ